MTNKVLITGANGYIGSHFANHLIQLPQFQVVATDILNTNLKKEIPFIPCDLAKICKDEKLFQLLGKPDICVHLAWRDGFEHNKISHLEDLPMHFNFLKNLIDHGVAHIVIAGSFREYGKVNGRTNPDNIIIPENLYCLSKLTLKRALEIYIHDKNVCLQWIRPFTVYGDDETNHSLMSKIIGWEKEGRESFPFTNGDEQYDYIHISELCKQLTAIISQKEVDGIIDCCSGKATRLGDKIEEFIQERNMKIKPRYGAFPTREYDSPIIIGNDTKIRKIMANIK